VSGEGIERYTRLRLAKTAYDAEDFPAARRLMKSAVARAEKIWGKNSVEIVESLKWLALATSGKNYGPAKAAEIAIHKRMLRILRRAYGDDDLRTASALDRCALDLWGHGKRVQALRAYRRVLAVKERHIGNDDDYRMWSILDAIGGVLIELRRPSEAIPFLERNARASEKGDHDWSKTGACSAS
jgi:hypothetical protein